MDDGIEVGSPIPWETVELNGDDYVFRQIPIAQLPNRVKRCPSEASFILRPGEDSLSFNLGRYIDVSKNYKLIAITYNFKNEYLNYTSFKIFKFPVIFLRSLSKFEKIIHDPKFTGAPSAIGNPNNKSHVLLYSGEFEVGVRAQLADYCLENHLYCYCDFDVKTIREDVEALKARWDESPYHNYWEFEN